MMIAVVIVGLVTALVVLSWRALEELRRADLELALAEDRAILAEMQTEVAEAHAKFQVTRADKALQQLAHVNGDQDTSQKPPSLRPSVAQ